MSTSAWGVLTYARWRNPCPGGPRADDSPTPTRDELTEERLDDVAGGLDSIQASVPSEPLSPDEPDTNALPVTHEPVDPLTRMPW